MPSAVGSNPGFTNTASRSWSEAAARSLFPLRQYYHRHTRSIFWEGQLIIIPFGNHALFRSLLGWMMPPKVSFLKLTQGESIRAYYEDRHVCQDILVPISHLAETIEFFHTNFECYPAVAVSAPDVPHPTSVS